MKKGILISVISVAAVLAAVAGVVFFQKYYDRKKPNFSGSFELYVYPDSSPEAVLDSIFASGKVLKPRSVRRAFKEEGTAESVHAGHYTVDSTMTSTALARTVRLGWETPVRLSISGAVRSPKTLARKIGAQMMADSAAVAAFVYNADSLSKIGTDTIRLFCHIVPDTYEMYWTAPVGEIFSRLKGARDAWWTPERLRKAKAQGLTAEEVSILASIVDGETRYVPEQPTIAGVYLNRLRTGMKLQADPTVAYCYGYTLNRIFRKHLEIDSPYNTYKYYGLPPGPISCPPKSCLEAVLNAEKHDYIFFCANPAFNGSHLFAVTYSDHQKNARAFQKALTERLKNKPS